MKCKELIYSDLYRYGGGFFSTWIFQPGFRYMIVFRICQSCYRDRRLMFLGRILNLILIHLSHKYGIQIPRTVKIGKGFYIGHFGTIVVNGSAVIGDNVNISHGVTIGATNRGNRQGIPTIGNQVYIGPGAKIIGKITVGNNVAIGANAVVTKDVPDNAVVAGVPAKIISMQGGEGYINRIV